ncbi:hypothetical protein CANCADRAFT_67144 [Tortispora caseinolytica NRRL Y-17796]|uniref:Uncharacterized protein n=1 Tax=Tortispora caseinolytica NRRL Y-17796 TaxID=767744 RepID=A0A1E4TKE2_9ASCO|nr:hypothetical protein CANCADRAFT_67144 [Tortispora caseinolytica NRRL Y-17796]
MSSVSDSDRSQVHMNYAHLIDSLEDWFTDKLDIEDVEIPPYLHALSTPEDEEEGLIPDQNAITAIFQSQKKIHETPWQDLELRELLESPERTRPGAPVLGTISSFSKTTLRPPR